MDKAKLRFLGTGTSQGIPIIGCKCPVCQSADPRDKRFRASAFVQYKGLDILIDAGPDFRSQMLASGIGHLDALFLTHNHKDHTGGLDDLRSLNYIDRKAVEIYCEPKVLESLKKEYSYVFADEKYPGAPEWRVHVISEKPFIVTKDTSNKELVWVHDVGYGNKMPDGSVVPTDGNIVSDAVEVDSDRLGEVEFPDVAIVPIRGFHDKMPVLGFRFGNIAYITDMSSIPEEEFSKLKGLDHVTLNTVGYRPHHSHFSLDEALEVADKIGAKHTWLTHLSHNFPCYEKFAEDLKQLCLERGIHSEVLPAYDGLVIEQRMIITN
ncbi:MAG: MBL fold metallo-hydrolase [Bacteroidales bacterium]|nr:MBL fold metallo-hydrolase [Bacteroidales bacterium]